MIAESIVVQSVDALSHAEINHYVAHEIFGWIPVLDDDDGTRWYYVPKHGPILVDRDCPFTASLPDFALDLQFIRLIQEYLAAKGAWTMSRTPEYNYVAEFMPNEGSTWKGNSMYPARSVEATRGLAVCRCALKAICGE